MKIKTTIPAINRSLFFGFGFVLFTSLVLLINWLFSLPLKQADTIYRQLIKTEQHIQQPKSMQCEFMLHFMKTEDLLTDKDELKEQDAAAVIRGIRRDIDYFRSFRQLTGRKDISIALTQLSASLDQFESNLKDFMLATIERGSEHSGLISRWSQLSSGMVKASPTNGPGTIRLMERIKQLETEYLLRGNPKTSDDIVAAAREIRNTFSEKETGISVADIDSYISLTTSLAALDKRIGSARSEGIVSNLDKSLNVLLNTSENANQLINTLIAKIRLRWTFLRYLVISLFTVSCIILLILITNHGMSRPLKSTLNYLQKLASGELPEEPLVLEGLPEIRDIDNMLGNVVQGLKEKVNLVHSLNGHDLTVNLNPGGPNDVLGRELISLQQQLIESADLQKKNDQENAQRRYINEGLARFGEMLRNRNNDIHVLGDVFIREIVKYMNAIQGGFFLLNDNHAGTPALELISAFAYNRKKYLQKSIPIGEGLVGTCAKEKQIINLTEIPKGYIAITSGLGDTIPENLLLVPVLHDSELIGVLEIASLQRFMDHEIRFAGEVAGSLGSTIIYARSNQRTAELLAKSQQQALEMTEQEEEMRQNIEELKATQEESVRREEEFRGIIEAIGHSLLMVEYNLKGIICNANDKFCIFSGLTREEITGKVHHEVLGGSLKTDAVFWEELRQKSQMTLVEKVKIGKKEYLLKEHFAVVLNRGGVAVQYINFITELST